MIRERDDLPPAWRPGGTAHRRAFGDAPGPRGQAGIGAAAVIWTIVIIVPAAIAVVHLIGGLI